MAGWLPGIVEGAEWLAIRLMAGSLQGALVIGVLWLVCRRFPSIPASLRTTLWWLVSLKLVLALVTLPSIPLPILSPESAPDAPAAVPLPAPAPLEPSALDILPQTPSSTFSPTFWIAAVIAIWAVVVLLHTARLFAGMRSIRRIATRSRPVGVEEAALLVRLGENMGLKTAPDARVSDEIETPQVVGIRRPIVLLPSRSFAALTDDERAMVLCHELAHVRRRDLLWGWVPVCAERLFFFHPLARLASREYALAREAACDAAVLAALDVAPRAYGRMLVRLGIAGAEPGVSAAGSSRSTSSLRRRLDMLQHSIPEGPRRAMWLVAGIIMVSMVPIQLVARSEVAERHASEEAFAAPSFNAAAETSAITPGEMSVKDSPAPVALAPAESAAQDPSVPAVEAELVAQRARIEAERRLEADLEARERELRASRAQVESALQADLAQRDQIRAALLQQLEALRSTDLQLAQQLNADHPARLALLEQIRDVQQAAAQQNQPNTADLEKHIDEMTAKLRELERLLREKKLDDRTANKVAAKSRAAAAAAESKKVEARVRALERLPVLRVERERIDGLSRSTARAAAGIDQQAPLDQQLAQWQRAQEALSRQLENIVRQQEALRESQKRLEDEAARIRAAIESAKPATAKPATAPAPGKPPAAAPAPAPGTAPAPGKPPAAAPAPAPGTAPAAAPAPKK